jgi:hypothetical protein
MMTKFNPEEKKTLTYGECLKPAMKITEQADADQYLRDYIAYIQVALDKDPRGDGKTAEEIAKINLGYFAGYYDREIQERVYRLFKTVHPIFGDSTPTLEEAIAAGLNYG